MQPIVIPVANLFHWRYEIPAYQREYEWNSERWQAFWFDIGSQYKLLEAGGNLSANPVHFLGAMILESQGSHMGQTNVHSVIDGQQRLVTLLVLLAAILHHKHDVEGTPLPKSNQLFWPVDHAGKKLGPPRIEVQAADTKSLDAVLSNSWRDWYRNARHSRDFEQARILESYVYFRYCLWLGTDSFLSEDPAPLPKYRSAQADETAEAIWQSDRDGKSNSSSNPQGSQTAIHADLLHTTIMDRLQILTLTMDSGDEEGPTIFDTMNADRTALEQWDFIRSSVFSRLPSQDRGSFFKSHWGPAQALLHKTSYSGLRANPRDAFVYDYLIARGEARHQGTINRNRGHAQFMRRVGRLAHRQVALDELIVKDFIPAAHAWVCAVGKAEYARPGPNARRLPSRARIARDTLMALSAGPPIPVVLHFIDQWAEGRVPGAELDRCLTTLESYVARHVICQTPMSPYRSKFMTAMGALFEATTAAELWEELKADWKTDADVTTALESKPLYEALKAPQLGAIFRGIELQLGGKGSNPVDFGKGPDQYSVEHIFPKSPADGPNAEWAQDFAAWGVSGRSLERMVDERHFLGNLTIVTNEANKKLGTKSFARKQDAFAGRGPIQVPPLAINRDIATVTQWTTAETDARRKVLTGAILKRWPRP